MKANEFNIPADFSIETIDQLALLNQKYNTSRVTEVYGSITEGIYFVSGRAYDNLPKVNLEKLSDYINYAKQKNIYFNYTFNSTHLQNNEFYPDSIKKIKNFLHDLHNAGVTTIILTLPPMYEIIRSTGLKFRIKASVLCEVTSANKAVMFKNMGADKIVPDESLTRNFNVLKQIVKVFGDEVELIANAWCTSHCQYRMFHYNQMAFEDGSRDSQVSNSYYSNRCYTRIFHDISNFLRMNWIRPEDLHYYNDIGIHHFKLQGRHLINLKADRRQQPFKGDIIKTVDAYLNEKYDGNLFDLLTIFNPAFVFKLPWDNKKLSGFIEPFIKNEDFCKKFCSECKYCENFTRKFLGEEEFKKTQEMCQILFKEIDAFQSVLWEDKMKKPSHFPL